MLGWHVATLGEDEAVRRLGELAGKRSPELKAAMVETLQTIARRLWAKQARIPEAKEGGYSHLVHRPTRPNAR